MEYSHKSGQPTSRRAAPTTVEETLTSYLQNLMTASLQSKAPEQFEQTPLQSSRRKGMLINAQMTMLPPMMEEDQKLVEHALKEGLTTSRGSSR